MSRIELLQILTGFLGSVGFAVLFNIRGKRLVAASIGGGLSWLFYLLLNPTTCCVTFWFPSCWRSMPR